MGHLPLSTMLEARPGCSLFRFKFSTRRSQLCFSFSCLPYVIELPVEGAHSEPLSCVRISAHLVVIVIFKAFCMLQRSHHPSSVSLRLSFQSNCLLNLILPRSLIWSQFPEILNSYHFMLIVAKPVSDRGTPWSRPRYSRWRHRGSYSVQSAREVPGCHLDDVAWNFNHTWIWSESKLYNFRKLKIHISFCLNIEFPF